MSLTLLREISFQLSRGNALWGLALANRYLGPSDPLRKAFATRAMQRLDGAMRMEMTALLEGALLADLPQEQQLAVGTRARRLNERATPRFSVTYHRIRSGMMRRPTHKMRINKTQPTFPRNRKASSIASMLLRPLRVQGE